MPSQAATSSSLPAAQEIELQALDRGVAPAFAGGFGTAGATVELASSPADGRAHDEGSSPGPRPAPAEDAEREQDELSTAEEGQGIPKWPFACLILQHLSSAFTERSYEFAAYLYLVILFPDSFVPAAVLGLLTTSTSLLLSGWVGGLVDVKPRLAVVRVAIGVQKIAVGLSYALFVVLFLPLRDATKSAWVVPTSSLTPAEEDARSLHWAIYLVFALVVVASSAAALAAGGLNVAVERDWVMTIADGNTRNLTTLNTYLRRINLLCALLCPLFVSLLTTTTAASYEFSLYFYLGLTVLSVVFEYVWVEVVYKSFPILAREEGERQARLTADKARKVAEGRRSARQVWATTKEDARQMGRDWADFARQPVFLSSIAISLVYLTTLSFDGIMLSYLKSQRSFSDPFIAGMRGLSVVMGLVGTAVMPFMERRMGLVRGGAWSLWAEIVCLAPSVVTLFVGLPKWNPPGPGEAWNVGLFFAFISLSRIGLWSFDLFQLQTLQEALKDHPRRNRLTALQLSLQSAFDLAKYGMVLGWSSPEDYKWTAVVSFGALCVAGGVYTVYVRRMRGHLFHWHKLPEETQDGAQSAQAATSHWQWKVSGKRREWGDGVINRKAGSAPDDGGEVGGVRRVESAT